MGFGVPLFDTGRRLQPPPHSSHPHNTAARESVENSGLISLCHSLPSFEKKEYFSQSKEKVSLLGMTFGAAPCGLSPPFLPTPATLSDPALQPVLASLLDQSLFHKRNTVPCLQAIRRFPSADEILLGLQAPATALPPRSLP